MVAFAVLAFGSADDDHAAHADLAAFLAELATLAVGDTLACCVADRLSNAALASLAANLRRGGDLSIERAADGQSVTPGRVYVLPAASDALVVDGALLLRPRAADGGAALGLLLASVAASFGAQAAAALASSDAPARGVRALRRAGAPLLVHRRDPGFDAAALAHQLAALVRRPPSDPDPGPRDAPSDLLDEAGVAALVVDRELRLRRITAALRELLPLTQRDLGRPLAAAVAALDEPQIAALALAVAQDGQTREDQVRDRHGRLLLRRCAPILADDAPAGVVLTLRDVTQVAAKDGASARHQAARLDQLMTHLPRGIVSVLDERLVFREVYGQELQRLNVRPADIVGHALEDIYSPESAALIRAQCERAFAENRLVSFENFFGAQSYLVSALPVPDEAGRSREILVLSTNVSELRDAHRDLHAAKEAAERANSARLTFLASMSHELRTPLAGMMGLLDLLDGEAELGAAPRLHLRRLRVLVDTQERLIADLLDLSRIDAQQLHLRVSEFDVGASLVDLAADARARSDADRIVEFTAPPPGTTFVGDPLRIHQIVDNLLSNALKYTPTGKIRVAVALDPQGALTIAVDDSGIGIDAEDLVRIFEVFVRVGELRHAAVGFGLGLPLVKRLVEQMGGALEVTSARGQGSTFAVTIPPAAASAAAAAPPTRQDLATLRGRRVLLVDDNDVIRLVVGELLRRDGVEVVEAEDAGKAERALAAHDFDALLVDIGLPDRDGHTLIRGIRAAEAASGSKRVPIVALTAYAYVEDRERSLAAGADAHLAKPVSHATLRAALCRLL